MSVEISAMIGVKREELVAVYTDALNKALEVADALEEVAYSLQRAINRLVEVDASMANCLSGPRVLPLRETCGPRRHLH
jgi:hypothetical protein